MRVFVAPSLLDIDRVKDFPHSAPASPPGVRTDQVHCAGVTRSSARDVGIDRRDGCRFDMQPQP